MTSSRDIFQQIERKKTYYLEKHSSRREDDAFKTLFDIAQELDHRNDIYSLCVGIPKSFFDLDARLHFRTHKTEGLVLVATSLEEPLGSRLSGRKENSVESGSFTDQGLLLTIRGRSHVVEQLFFQKGGNVLGILEIFPHGTVEERVHDFLRKYVAYIGLILQDRFLIEKNFEHHRFIRTLVADIEHNVIVPNMIYKLYLRNLKNMISKCQKLEGSLEEVVRERPDTENGLKDILDELDGTNKGLLEEFSHLENHHKNISLFLETLFRSTHFDEGRLIIRTKPCNMKRDVVQVQLERYRDRFASMGVEIDDRFSYMPDEEVITVVDVGLIAQVYANLFGNAVKYAQEIHDESGQKRKYISYGRELLPNFFGPGKDGIKYNVFSTGAHIDPADRDHVFEDGYRCKNSTGRQGTGHGLAFVRNVVEIHGGVTGYEPTPHGNNFYFILPT